MLGRGPRRGADGALAKTSRSWAGRVASLFGGPDLGDELWDGLEEALLGADLGVPTTFELLDRLRARVSRERIREPGEALAALRSEVAAMLRSGGEVEDLDGLLYPGDGERPLVVLVVGVNGVGKTTTIAKLAHMYRSAGAGVVLGAADTFRAAAIEQLQAWGEALGVRVVAHGAGADPGAVAFDAVRAARAAGADVAIVDTAGRMHTRSNLMEEAAQGSCGSSAAPRRGWSASSWSWTPPPGRTACSRPAASSRPSGATGWFWPSSTVPPRGAWCWP